jgi:hypothetical protein
MDTEKDWTCSSEVEIRNSYRDFEGGNPCKLAWKTKLDAVIL